MNKKLVSMGTLLFVVASSQLAAGNDLAVGLKLSTLGPGLEIQERLSSNLGVRAGINYLPFSTKFTIDDVEYKTDFSWKSLSLLADLYPFSGIFRITGGVFYNGNNVGIAATPKESVKIGDNTYTPEQIGSLNGSVDFKKIVPYAGIGWSGGNASSGEWSASFDLGVLFQGSPSVNNLNGTGAFANTSIFKQDLEKEHADIEDEMDTYKYYPVVAFALSYHF
jgi:hypothetical protein